ncbi:MAG: class I SAM-dependent methyltransferase [Halomonadaceae bacterium]|nr:MAG: class I SAM-dependent methyltransferase [Halomonadaceae bacterium]
MSSNALYTNLSGYYDLMCAGINYQAQSNAAHRLNQIFGNKGSSHLDLACGTGPHIRHFLDLGYHCSGLDINPPMLDRAKLRCPEAHFTDQDMCGFTVAEPVDLVTCFLYSIHYSDGLAKLKACIACVHKALKPGGVFCFNAVDKHKIDNSLLVRHTANYENSHFVFSSGWNYGGEGEKQSLVLSIEKTTAGNSESWQDEHPMVAVSFEELQALLQPYFEVHRFEHDYEKIVPLAPRAGNALFVGIKK